MFVLVLVCVACVRAFERVCVPVLLCCLLHFLLDVLQHVAITFAQGQCMPCLRVDNHARIAVAHLPHVHDTVAAGVAVGKSQLTSVLVSSVKGDSLCDFECGPQDVARAQVGSVLHVVCMLVL